MAFDPPTLAQLRKSSEKLGFHLTDADLESFLGLMAGAFEAYGTVDQMPDELPEVKYPRQPGVRPPAEENPLGAWYVKTSVKGAPTGKLQGRSVALKDNICLAGVAMMGGASVLEGYAPEIDATIVERILDAGGEILGKAVCEYFSTSGGSHTSATGPVHNPRKKGYSAGGSSSGSAALVAAGEVDLAMGADQAGSIRIPSSFCGVCGLKPTYGLVPYTGIMSLETTLDHTGPMTAGVADNALLLEIIAGPDGIDPRQRGVPSPAAYTEALGTGVEGLRIGVVEEGFGHPSSDPRVDAGVRAAARRLEELGAELESLSIPMHRMAGALFTPLAAEGITAHMMHDYGFGTNQEGLHLRSLLEACTAWRSRPDELSEPLKLLMLLGQTMRDRYHGAFYARAANLRRRVRAAYDRHLEKADLLLMPTLPITATPLPGPDASREEVVGRAVEMRVNTAQFNITGHPALSIPCALVGGLPVGMMLIGRYFEEFTIYRAADAFEQSGNWEA